MLLSGSSIRPRTLRLNETHSHEVRDVVVLEREPRFAITLDDRGAIALQNIDIVHRGRPLVRLDKAERLAWQHANALLVGTSTDNLLVYDVETSRQTALYDNSRTWFVEHGLMSDLKISSETSLSASASLDSTVTVWDNTARRAVHRWRATDSTMPVYTLATHGTALLSGGGDGILRLWDLRRLPSVASEAVGSLRCRTSPCSAVATYELPGRIDITSLDYSVNGTGILIGGAHGYVSALRAASFTAAGRDGEAVVALNAAFDTAHAQHRYGTRETLARYLTTNSRYVAYTRHDTLCLSDISNPRSETCVPPRVANAATFTALAVVHASRTVVTGDANGNLGVWRIDDD